MYELFGFIGYFFYLLVFLSVAIIFAKKLHAWIWYSIGAIITLISLIVNHISVYKQDGDYFANEEMSPYWAIYVVLLLISALVIFYRYSVHQKSFEDSDENSSNQSKFSETLSKIPNTNEGKTWECKQCGTKNPQNSIHCKNCGNYK